MAFSAADLWSTTVALAQADHLASIYKRFKPMAGLPTDQLKTTLNDAGVTGANVPAAGSTMVLTAPISGPSWGVVYPYGGIITIGTEDILVTFPAAGGNTATVARRGANGTTPVAHANASTVYLPGSIAAYAKQLEIDIIGDGSTVYGVGANAVQVVNDLLPTLQQQVSSATLATLLENLVSPWIAAWNNHIQNVAPSVLVAASSYGTVPPTDFNSYLRYLNDPMSGTPYSMLVSAKFAYLYWLVTGQYLDNKAVFPDVNSFGNFVFTSAGGAITPTFAANINRYSDPTQAAWTQGYAAQPIQARVTVANGGAGTHADIVVTGEGMDSNENYFGRSTLGGNDGQSVDNGASSPTALHTWRGVLTMTNVGTAVTLTPDVAGDKLLAVTTVSLAGTSDAHDGTFVLETVPPRAIV